MNILCSLFLTNSLFVYFQITEAGKDVLPSWLTFNPLKTELRGIPGPDDKGRIYLEVKVTGDDNSQASDVFSIEVLEDTNGQTSAIRSPDNGAKVIKCRQGESQTTVTVVVDCDMHMMNSEDKMSLLDNMANHLNLSPEMIKMMPVGDRPMFDTGALVIGPGNIKEPKMSGGMMSWMVGCGQVADEHMPILHQVETAAANGDMSSALGHDIVGWHVTNTRFQLKPRKRRQAATATPTMTPPAPTKVVEVSSTEAIEASSTMIMPSKTVDMTSTVMVETSTHISPSQDIAPSESMKMVETDTSSSTPVLPTTSSRVISTSSTQEVIMPSTTTTSTPSTKAETPAPKPEPTEDPLCPETGEKQAPRVNKPLGNIVLEAGMIQRYKISEDSFLDCYDAKTSDLDLQLKNADGKPLPDGFWLQLKERAFKPYHLLSNPLNSDAGTYNLMITVINIYGKSIDHEFTVTVKGTDAAVEEPNHELSMSIDTDFDAFMSDLDNRIELSNKVATIFGDKNSKSLTVTRLEKGSVVYAWTNNSMSTTGCPVEELNTLVGKMFNEDGTLTNGAVRAMKPYTINSAAAAPQGACENNPDFPSRSTMKDKPTSPLPMPTVPVAVNTTTKEMTSKPKPTPKEMEKTTTQATQTTAAVAAAGAGTGGSDIWITTVVPAIVVVVVLIIALIIACCLYRKKRKGKMKLEEKKNFSSNKGVPVIFADEYEEKTNDSKHPLILEEEKPPMPPPGYQRASSETSGNSTNSTQPIEDKDAEEIELEDTSEISPLYTPPPPVTASNNSKPPHVQSSRGPPPYVPP